MPDEAVRTRVDEAISAGERWANRRKLGIPNNKRLFVLTCMDERVDIEAALGLELGDAHIFRNAGALVTDDVVRSAALTTNFFDTAEIIIVLHTECGMLLQTGDTLAEALDEKLKARGTSLDATPVDPAIPELTLPAGQHGKWIRAFDDLEAAALRQVELLRSSPLIPESVPISAYIYDVATRTLRRPRQGEGRESVG